MRKCYRMQESERSESSVFSKIASLHARSLRDNGLSRCEIGFIAAFYQAVVSRPSTILMTESSDEGEFAGFILCSTDCHRMFSDALRTIGFKALMYPRGLVFVTLRALANRLRGEMPVKYNVEFLFGAVEERCRRQGVWRRLMAKALEELTKRGEDEVFLRVSESNSSAARSHEALGFKTVTRWHGKLIMRKELCA